MSITLSVGFSDNWFKFSVQNYTTCLGWMAAVVQPTGPKALAEQTSPNIHKTQMIPVIDIQCKWRWFRWRKRSIWPLTAFVIECTVSSAPNIYRVHVSHSSEICCRSDLADGRCRTTPRSRDMRRQSPPRGSWRSSGAEIARSTNARPSESGSLVLFPFCFTNFSSTNEPFAPFRFHFVSHFVSTVPKQSLKGMKNLISFPAFFQQL